MEKKQSLSSKADQTNAERQASYGSPVEDFTRSSRMLSALGFACWNANLKKLEAIEPKHIPVIMSAIKLSRLMNSPDCYQEDTWLDLIGYANTSQEIHNEANSKSQV